MRAVVDVYHYDEDYAPDDREDNDEDLVGLEEPGVWVFGALGVMAGGAPSGLSFLDAALWKPSLGLCASGAFLSCPSFQI